MFLLPEDLLHRPGHVWHDAAISWRKDSNARINFLESIHDRLLAQLVLAVLHRHFCNLQEIKN